MRSAKHAFGASAVFLLAGLCLTAAAEPLVTVTVSDSDGLPIPAAKVEVRKNGQTSVSADTDGGGHAGFLQLLPGHYSATATRQGFEPARAEFEVTPAGAMLEMILLPSLARHESVEVHDSVTAVPQQSATAPAEIPAQEAK